MSELTPRLGLPLIGDHSQKRLVMNEGLMRLESLVQARVLSRTTMAEPATPADGDSYILPAAPAGATWSLIGEGVFVRSESGTWEIAAFPDGAIVHIADENRFVIRSGGAWAAFEDVIQSLDNLARLGIGTAADAYNVLALKGAAALLSAQYAGAGGSGDISLALNREADGGTAQMLFQTDYSTRAVLGLLGDNTLSLKVSPDGASFVTAIAIDAATGALTVTEGSDTSPAIRIGSAGGGFSYSTVTFPGLHLTGPAGTAVSFFAMGDGNSAGISAQRYQNTTAGPSLALRKARGSLSAPALGNSGDTLGLLVFSAYSGAAGSGFSNTASLSAFLTETTPGSTAQGTRLAFAVAPNGSVTTQEVLGMSVANGLTWGGAGNTVIDANRNVRARIYTVATLPSASSAAGQRAQVSDATSPVFAAAVAGGGSTHTPVYSNGTAWLCG